MRERYASVSLSFFLGLINPISKAVIARTKTAQLSLRGFMAAEAIPLKANNFLGSRGLRRCLQKLAMTKA